jgi:hypothetical protein
MLLDRCYVASDQLGNSCWVDIERPNVLHRRRTEPYVHHCDLFMIQVSGTTVAFSDVESGVWVMRDREKPQKIATTRHYVFLNDYDDTVVFCPSAEPGWLVQLQGGVQSRLSPRHSYVFGFSMHIGYSLVSSDGVISRCFGKNGRGLRLPSSCLRTTGLQIFSASSSWEF